MNNSFCKYGNECRNNQKKRKRHNLSVEKITCPNGNKKCKDKLKVQKTIKNIEKSIGLKYTNEKKNIKKINIKNINIKNISNELFEKYLDKVCLQKEKNKVYSSLNECRTKVELETNLTFKEDTITMDKELSGIVYDTESKKDIKSKICTKNINTNGCKHYYDLYIDFTKFFNKIFKKCNKNICKNNGYIRKKKIKTIKEKMIEKFNEKNEEKLSLKNKAKIEEAKFILFKETINLKNINTNFQEIKERKNRKDKLYLRVRFKIKDFFNNIVWNDKMKNKLRLSKGKFEKALKKKKLMGLSILNNNNEFYEL